MDKYKSDLSVRDSILLRVMGWSRSSFDKLINTLRDIIPCNYIVKFGYSRSASIMRK